MSRTDHRTTTRELRAALERRDADRNSDRDRRNWGNGSSSWWKAKRRRRERHRAKELTGP